MVGSSSKTVLASNFFISILLGTSLQTLWGTINVCQIIFFMGMINIRHSANIIEFFSILSSLLQLDIVSLEDTNIEFSTSASYIQMNPNFLEYGFETNAILQTNFTGVAFQALNVVMIAVCLFILKCYNPDKHNPYEQGDFSSYSEAFRKN